MHSYWLSLSVWVPIVAGLVVLAVGDRNLREARGIALLGAVIGFLVTVPLVAGFQTGTSAMQFVELEPWIPHFNVNYHLGVDGISVLFILLNSFITVLVVIAGWEVIRSRVAQYMAAFLVMSGLLNGTFAALDAVIFYVFYGFIRFSLPILPYASHYLAGFMITLSLIAIVYIGLVALVQTDMKKLIAYSSISHMGFVTLGFFIFNAYGMEGGLVQMISHGFVSAALFLCVGVLYDRMHSRNIADYGGVVNTMPKFAALMMLFAMANCGLPATSGFVGEFMVIVGAMKFNFWIAFLAGTTLVFGAAYTLWMVKRVIFGGVGNRHVAELTDANARELLVLGLLAIAVLWLGVHPAPFTEIMHASVSELLKHVAVSKL